MNTCFICQTKNNLVHSGVDALLLECLNSIGKICYDCANRDLAIRQEARAVKL
jgi:hypothetical protein